MLSQARGAPSAAPLARAALARLRRELAEVRRAGNPQIAVSPSEDCMLEWHFALHSLPADTPYHGGCYHGQLHFPPEYPHAPPSIVMVTPSGRLETGQRLCLSMTDFHPESWNPAWSVETILVGLLSFFTSDQETGFGSVSAPDPVRRELAAKSWAANARDPEFAALFPELLAPPVQEPAASSSAPRPPRLVSPREEEPVGAPLPTECWICRCDTDEPLVWPCACRGSMGGVHPSCVEHWLRCQRRAGRGGERPRCLVCNARYTGREVRPGLLAFARHHLVKTGSHLVHCSVVVGLLVGVQEFLAPSDEGAVLPRPVSALAAAAFPVFCLHKLAVLLVSLPPHRAPPRRRAARQFFVSDMAQLARHVAEALTVVIVTGLGWACGALHWAVFAPLAAAAVGVVLNASEAPPLVLAHAAAATLLRLAVVLAALAVQAGRRVARRPRGVAEALHPLGAGPHVVASLVVLPLAWCVESNVPVLAVWSVHAGLAAVGLADRLTLRRLRWRPGVAWWYAVQLAAVAAYVANAACEWPHGAGAPGRHDRPVLAASGAWLLVLSSLAAAANWGLCRQRFRRWQRQHSAFRLAVPPARVVRLRAGAGAEV